nr:hypothetical protein TetV2_00184 [Oceanusvirus sp.]
MKSLSLIVRGHERGSFRKPAFRRFCDRLAAECARADVEFRIHLHTWSESEAKSSHRPLDRRFVREIKCDTVKRYFDGLPLCSLSVENDADVVVSGRAEGRLGGVPIRAWKYMWHGIHSATERAAQAALDEDDDCAFAVCVRVDNFQNMESRAYCDISEDRIVEKAKEIITGGSSPGGIHFFGGKETPGIDNCYAGRVSAVRRLVKRFHEELDDIARLYPKIHHQEFLVFHEARQLEASRERLSNASAVSRSGRIL